MMHMSTSIEGLLRRIRREKDRRILNYTHKDDDTRYASLKELEEDLQVQLAKGHVLIKDSNCDNFDPVKGCLGCEMKQEETDAHSR
jgi:hypothetical protein